MVTFVCLEVPVLSVEPASKALILIERRR